MKQNVVRYCIVLIGLVAMSAVRANAQDSHRNAIQIESSSWGISSGQLTRVSVVNFGFADGSVRMVTASIQILDTEGEVIAQSHEIEVAPGKTRFWDVPRALLPPGERNGRIQVRARILVTTDSFDLGRPHLAPTVELIDPSTGRSAVYMEF